MQVEVGGTPCDHHNPCLQQARRQEVVGIFFDNLYFDKFSGMWQALTWTGSEERYSAEDTWKTFKICIYSGGGGLFPFPFPIHLVSIFLSNTLHWVNERG